MIRRSAPLSRPCHPCGLDLRPSQGPIVEIEGRVKHALDVGRTRLVVAGLCFALAFFLLAYRLVDLGVWQASAEPALAAGGEPLNVGRADIVDRNGVVLATTLPVASLYADAREIRDPAAAAASLTALLSGVDEATLAQRLASGRSFVYVKRRLTPREEYEVNRLGIPGLYFQREMIRIYPLGSLTSQVVGLAGIDNRGLAGIEQSMDERLRSSPRPLQLSIDLRVQHMVAEELAKSVAEFEAIGAAGLVLDLETGEILASVSLPTYDPMNPGTATEDQRFNRVTLGVYEMGSTMKMLTAAMALEAGTAKLTSGYDASRPLRVGRFTISDFKGKNRWLSVPEIIIYSSNIGAASMAREVGATGQREFLTKLGLTRPAKTELPETGWPMVPSPWRDINMLTIAYGHGIAISPLQLANAVGATINGGILRPATFLKNENGTAGERVLSEETSASVRWLMRLNVLKGSGRKAEVAGYLVGGKTGTAEKLINGRYSAGKRMSSFIGAFPMDRPRYLVLSIIDEPKPQPGTGGYATGSIVGAPVTGRIIARLGPLLGLQPADPVLTAATDRLIIPASVGGTAIAAN